MEAHKNNSLHDLFKNLAIGIGEVSNLIGVSQRQLRYWEQKGFIKPIPDQDAGVRRYNLATIYKIAFIKDQLDKGYTLHAAFNNSKDIEIKSKIMRKFLRQGFDDVTITDRDKAYGEID